MKCCVYLRNMGSSCLSFDERDAVQLQRAVPDLEVVLCRSETELLAALPTSEVVIVWRFEQAWFELAPRLKWLITPAAGRDYFKVDPPAGVRQHYGSFHGKLMGETVVGMILAASRGILTSLRLQPHNPWPTAEVTAIMRLLRGSHVVIVGFGHIGHWIGQLAKPFGVRITGIARTNLARPAYLDDADQVLPVAALDSVLPDTDHLVFCLPGGAETKHVLTRRRLCLLPSTAWVYNVGRGNAIDQTALRQALCGGTIAGACLDVFQQEPLPVDDPLRDAPNLLIMPHASAFAPDYMAAFVDELAALFRGNVDG